MNVFNKVTLQSLKKNKTRTIITIIGIMLSAAMICAVTTFASSLKNYLLDYSVYNEGDWHGALFDASFEDYENISEDKEISSLTYNQIIGYAKIESKNEYKPYIYILGADRENFFKTMPVHLIKGNYPKTSDEIIIPEHIRSNGGVNYQLGDTITLEIGQRMADGADLGQNNPYHIDESEEIKNTQTKNYTIVGIYERPAFENYTAPGYTAITIEEENLNTTRQFDIYFKMHNPKNVYDYTYKYKLGTDYNTDVLMFSGVSEYDGFSTVLISLSAIVIILIMFGSVSLIYNAFAISVSERTKQFGLLSSIGATKKQLKKMVLFEALTVSSIGIPLGIIVGILGIGVTLLIIGNKFATMFNSYTAPMRICVSFWSIVIAVIIALITVLISAWIPSKRATKVSVVEAIRQTSDIKINNKQPKTSKIIYKLFGLPAVIALKHYKRNKKKYRATVVSLFMSIILFVSASAFTDYLTESVTGGFAANDFELSYYVNESDIQDKTLDEVLQIFMSDKDVTNGAYTFIKSFEGQIPNQYLTQEYISIESQKNNSSFINGYIHFLNDSEFDKLIKKYGLNSEQYYNKSNPVGIALESGVQFDYKKEKYLKIDTLNSDICEISCEVAKDEVVYNYTLKCNKTIVNSPFYINASRRSSINLIYPLSMLESVLPQEIILGYDYNYFLQSDNHTSSFENLKTVLTDNNLVAQKLYDNAKDEEMNRNIVIVVRVFSYGFVVLISLISVANVFNTISTNISLRRREFAMLKSVGMTQKGFNKMMNFECMLYGSEALVLGLPVSAGITYLIYKAISDGFETTYHLPWNAIGISILSVFLVVFVTMMYSMNKIKKENPIDALKNENL